MKRRQRAKWLVVLSAWALLAAPLVGAAAQTPPPGQPAGTGRLEGTEIVQDEQFLGIPCFRVIKSIFRLRGVGTYHGRTAGGQPVVYKADINQGETLHGDGPLRVEVENTETYYHGPEGTHGTTNTTCGQGTAGEPVPAAFRLFAPDHVYRLDGTGAQVPCPGQGSFARGNMNAGQNWHAEWTLAQECTVVGNAAGTPGTGTAGAGTGMTHAGRHAGCFNPPCVDNFKVDFTQYLPLAGFHVSLSGPASAQVGTQVTLTAAVTNDGQPVPNAAVAFSVTGSSAGVPPDGAAVTGADGKASFAFTAAVAGDYHVGATARTATQTASSVAHRVTFTPTAPPAVTLTGPDKAQTEEGITVTATFTNAGTAVPGASVDFTVAGAGQASPAMGSALTDQNGKATFRFAGNRAGDYTVTASSTLAGQSASDTHIVHLDINTLYRVGALGLPESGRLLAALIDPGGRSSYFYTDTAPPQVVKVDLATFTQVGALALNNDEFSVRSALIDHEGRYAYLANNGVGTPRGPAQVIKVDLTTLQRVGAITLASGESVISSAIIDPTGAYAYFGTSSVPGQVVKVDLGAFQRVSAMTLQAGENNLTSAVTDPAGRYAYFGAQGEGTTPGRVVKLDLGTFQRLDAVLLESSAENQLLSAVMDPAGRYAYFGTFATPGRVVKIDLTAFQRVGSITMASTSERNLYRAVIDPAGRYAYFAPAANPGIVVKVDLASFARVHAVTLPAAERGDIESAVIDPAGNFAYFGKSRSGPNPTDVPAAVVKIAVSRPAKVALSAANDTYTTAYATPLSVAAPGVLANDSDTGDGDPLTADVARGPAHGSVSLNANGSFSYTPESGFSGTDTFTYTASDAMDYSAPATVSVAVGAPTSGVSSVSGGAFGFSTMVSLFGGPAEPRGPRPAVNLGPGGGNETATDPDGDVGQYGPAYIFENHGELTVRTQGTTGETGSMSSSASVRNVQDNDPFHAGAPDGEVSSTCTASQAVLGGSTRIVNGRLVVHTHPTEGTPTDEITFPHTWDPAPNTTYDGALDHIGDRWRIVFNEQILSPEAITVNAVHMYLLGPTAVGDMIIGQSRCGVVTSAANAAPVGNDDAYTATTGRPLVVPAAGVLANDTDADGQALTAAKRPGIRPPASGGGTWTFPGEPAHGTLDLRPDGSFTYTPVLGYSGPDSFTYLAQDSRGKSDPATVSLTVAPATAKAVADFDGNGATDLSVFRPNSGTWYLQGSPQANYGASGDIAVPADYDGDGKSDVAVFRPSDGVWYVKGSAGTDTAVGFGANGDVPVPADYDGDAKADIAVFRGGVWYVKGSAGTDSAVAFGASGDIPVPADYDGDGKADRAVFRGGVWYVKGSAGTDTAIAFGTSGDVPVPGDYDGNGTAEVAVFRPSNGVWFVQGGAATAWGTTGDVPVPGDYDGDGDLEIAVFRPANGVWFVQGGATTAWGASGDVAVPLPAAVRQAMG